MLLAVETSGPLGGIALVKENEILDKIEWTRSSMKGKGSSHSELITVHFSELLKKNNISHEHLDGLIVSQGPGSFTGIRVAINFVKSLAYCLDIPIFAYDSLSAMAFQKTIESLEEPTDFAKVEPVACILNAFKNMVYFATYEFSGNDWKVSVQPMACEIHNLESVIDRPHTALGDGLDVYGDSLPEKFRKLLIRPQKPVSGPSVEGLVHLHLSQQKHFNEETREETSATESSSQSPSTYSWKQLQPLYLRASSAEENRDKGLLKSL